MVPVHPDRLTRLPDFYADYKAGRSIISVKDLAVAIVDETESRYSSRRFTAAY